MQNYSSSLWQKMYRDRPRPRRAYQSLPRPYQPEPGYRDDRSRPRPPYLHSYNNYRQSDSYPRSPPHRYPSPRSGRHRDGHFRNDDPPRQVREPGPNGQHHTNTFSFLNQPASIDFVGLVDAQPDKSNMTDHCFVSTVNHGR